MASIGFRIKTKENKEASIYVYFRVPNSSVISSRTGFSVNPKKLNLLLTTSIIN
jgi:hypothetical protein